MLIMPPVFNAGDTIYFFFNSYAGSTGASATITGLLVGDIEVYKNGSVTQRASDNGYALLDTDGIDFDGSVGLNGFSIDTSDNSDSGFWADGAQYLVHVDAITVDSQTVRFSYLLTLGYLLRPTTAGRKLDVSSGGEAGMDLANVGSPTTTLNLSGTTIKTATDVETDTADIQSRLPAALVGGRMDANMGAISTDATAADNAEAFFDGTGYAGTNNVIPTVTTVGTVNLIGGGGIQETSFANGCITDEKILDGAFTAAKFAASSLNGKGDWNVGKTGYTLTPTTGLGNQTANITGSITNVTGGINTAAGTIQTLDDLDTAQDTQHATTQTLVNDIPTNAEMANVLTMGTRFLTMIQVSSGSIYQYTVDAVENAPSGGGGGGDPIVVLVPGIAQVPERARGRLIELYVQEAITIAVPVLDANGDPMDLSAVDLWFGATDRRGVLQINTAAGGSVTGTETGFSLTLPVQTSPANDWKWALRYDTPNGANIVDGPLTIKFSPSKP